MNNTNFSLGLGHALPLGTSVHEDGVNFSVYCPDAEQVWLCLFDENEQEIAQFALSQRIQSKWFGKILGVKAGQLYGYRVKPKTRKNLLNNSKDKLLIDPYARQINRALQWDEKRYEGDSQQLVSKSVATDSPSEDYNSYDTPVNNRIVYEAHVKGLSMLHPEVPESIRGTYLGACHPSILAHLKKLGVTTVQFQPLMAFMPEPFISNKGLTNYWGYNPINFFAAEPRYAVENAYVECREMIRRYRESGLEVILDVVFNHTAESGADGPILSLKGMCREHAYLIEEQDESDSPVFLNYSGCGNTLKVSDSYILNLVLDAMRYWVKHMGVQGFRFDLATIVGREVFDFRTNATFFRIVNQDPSLKGVLMLAEPWDIGQGGYQLGNFPAQWLEVNDKFRDTVRGFWRGDKGLKGDFATRFMGSRDIFKKTKRPMQTSVNNVTYHDGFTLHDVVSYAQKHNEANLENNRDGHNHNLSDNYGHEGETNDESILNLRYQQKRNLFASLILSQGTPHLTAGDELSKTQHGNNNAYCQDNELNYLHWDLDERKQAFLNFCQYVIRLRQRYPVLQCMHFKDDQFDNLHNVDMVDWYRRDGSHKTDIDWVNHEHHCFAMHLIASEKYCRQEWVFCFNSADTEKSYSLPVFTEEALWQCVLDTSMEDPESYASHKIANEFSMPARSFKIFLKDKQ